MKVRVTDAAKADLRQIKAFLSRHSVSAAVSVIEQIRKTLRLLALLPRLGHAGAVHGTFEKRVPRVPYLVVYRIDLNGRDELVILRVYHTAQDRSGDAF
jgi:plasmid stabilization system protein ParE